MRRVFAASLVFVAVAACGSSKNGGGDDDGGDGGPTRPDACVGLECQVVNCQAMGQEPTALVGKVFAPNGSLPLFGANVYVPRETPGPFTEGAQCSRCSDELSGSPIVRAQTDDTGSFRLDNLPAGDNIPVVIQLGKWRRQIVIPRVAPCVANDAAPTETRLPRNKSEGDIPRIAITTGDADTMECLVRKLGIDDSEIGNDGDATRIKLYHGDGTPSFKGGFAGGNGNMAEASTLWNSLDKLKENDIVFFSCEGAQLPNNGSAKSPEALDAVKAYADLGGRVFASHWHNIWISGKFQGGVDEPDQALWKPVASEWGDFGSDDDPVTMSIDEISNPKGASFANWMVNVGASTTRGKFPIIQWRTTARNLDTSKAERWVYTEGQDNTAQMFQFTTPIEQPLDARCGKVVFSDMHVSLDPSTVNAYPTNCVGGEANLTMSEQEKALAFMFFDIGSCVGVIY